MILVNPGRSAAGRRAALSHTGALAAEDRVVDGTARQLGVLRTDELEDGAERLGIRDIILKPFSMNTIERSLSRLLGCYSPGDRDSSAGPRRGRQKQIPCYPDHTH